MAYDWQRKQALPTREARPHACSLHAEVAGHGQAPYRGNRPWPGFLQGAVGYSQGPRARGRPATTRPPVRGDRYRPAHKGLPLAENPATSRGGGVGRKGGHPLARRFPTAKGSRRLRKGSGDDDAVRVKEG
ncbi:hypothetical protein B296_00021980 [Ensete ventricosum]|uniref:Uncharacterized protein n=1 Tax=Ensete ventricosum TaxID=4639 RepID=A0A426ZET6_ENSVE|nr:hypothetical protein B296_00021980 [Ensete ventricosum]